MHDATLSIIIPVYNERGTVATLLDRVLAAPLSLRREVLVVNDGSTDGSGAIVEAWQRRHAEVDSRLLHLPRNCGKGAAVRAGIAASRGEVVIIQDADLEYDPADYEACIAPILRGECHVVYGSREVLTANRRHSSLAFYLGGRAVTFWFNLLYGCRLSDEPTCYKTFRGPLVRALDFQGNGFEWEPEVTAKLLRLGLRIHEVPVHYSPRPVAAGKKIRWTDGLRAFWEAWRWRFRSVDSDRARLAEWLPT